MSFAKLLPLLVLPVALAAACAPAEIPDAPLGKRGNDPTDGSNDTAAGKKKTTTPKPSTETPAPASNQAPPPAPQADQAPTLTSVEPGFVTVGSSANGVDLILTGTKFPTSAQVSLAGDKLPTTFVSPTQLKLHVGADKLKATGVLRLLVVASAGDSNALTFTVANPTSTSIAQLSPANVVLGATNDVTLNVTGAGFTPQSVVKFNGAALSTTFTSATQLSATVPSNAFLDAGRVSVTVALGTDVVSLPAPFEIRNPSPTADSVSPGSVAAGASAAVTVSGTGFTKGSTVLANGQAISTTFVSGSSLRANVPSNLVTKAGSVSLTVQNGTPGGGTSRATTLSVTAAATGSSGAGPDCAYLCKDYGYAAGECYADYYCIDTGIYAGCLGQASCGGAVDTGAGAGGAGAGGAAACTYTCSAYGYAPGECSNGWYCWISDGCLTQSTCN